jgi:hypothetical protein
MLAQMTTAYIISIKVKTLIIDIKLTSSEPTALAKKNPLTPPSNDKATAIKIRGKPNLFTLLKSYFRSFENI